jgi:hypothetical protein
LTDGNMEGKEVRFGIADSALFATITTAASCGAVNSMHDSFTPLGGAVPLVMMQLGEVVFGGVGSGLYGMLIFAVMAVFIAGLMIGRTPEYLGKKIEAHEMKMTSIAILATPLLVLVGTAVAVMTEAGRAGIANPGAHGFAEILYAFSSAANNNGSAFAGLSANTPFYNVLLALAMWFGRFAVIVPVLAMAGSLAAKKRISVTAGTLPTHGPLFVTLLIGVVLLVGLLNYVPALALGPLVEHLMLWSTHDSLESLMTRKTFSLFDPALVKPAIADSFRKLDPRVQWRNPVMFVVFVGSILTTLAAVPALSGPRRESTAFILGVAVWLWFTVLFANFRRGACRRAQQGAGGVIARPEEGNLGEAVERPARGRRVAHGSRGRPARRQRRSGQCRRNDSR